LIGKDLIFEGGGVDLARDLYFMRVLLRSTIDGNNMKGIFQLIFLAVSAIKKITLYIPSSILEGGISIKDLPGAS